MSCNAFKWPHLIDQCKIYELSQCIISNVQVRSVCLSKQFIEPKQADFPLMTLFSRQHWQHHWKKYWYVTYRLTQSSYTNQALLQCNLDCSKQLLKTHTQTHTDIQTYTLGLGTHFLITGANLGKTITKLIESSLVEECIKRTHTQTHPHTEEESLQGHLSYLLSHFSYHLGFVNSQWGGNAISGVAHSRIRSAKKKKKRSAYPLFMINCLPHEVTARGKPIYSNLLPTSIYDSCWVLFFF